MTTPQFNPNNVKHALRQRGFTMTSWAEANGFKFRDVSDVVRGIRHGNYGKGREIAEKLTAFIQSVSPVDRRSETGDRRAAA